MNVSLSVNDAAKNLHNTDFWYQLLPPGWRQNIEIVIFHPNKHVKVSDLQRSPNPIPCSKQISLDQVTQGHVQSVAEYFQGWKDYSLSG